MAERRTTRRRPPALTPEAAERRCIESAYNLAQRQLDEGSASPSVITHFLKMGTARAQLEQEKLRKETELLQTKKIAIEETKNMEQLFSEAISAMKRYQGYSEEEEDDEDWD
ncbi:MAG: hypothetical protein IJ880_06775 [Bacilli bacterium]|nr:hypothetical protein [Bacilli bacterium]